MTTLEELFSPLQADAATDAEIQRLLAVADRRTRRRRIRFVTAGALATAAVTATLAALPSTQAPIPTSAAAILRTAAATAAEQPGPPAWTGFRYVQTLDRRGTVQDTEEEWVDSTWQGRLISTGRFAGKPLDITTPDDMPNLYGDGPLARVPLRDLPTDPAKLADLLLAAHRDGRWTPGGGWDLAPGSMHYEVLRDLLQLLTLANASPQQRSALITVLTNYDGVTPLPSVRDARDREGRGVTITVAGQAPVTVIFAPDTSELLEWSQGDEVHTFLRFGHVKRIGDRP